MEFRGENFFEKKIFPAPLSKNFKRIKTENPNKLCPISQIKVF